MKENVRKTVKNDKKQIAGTHITPSHKGISASEQLRTVFFNAPPETTFIKVDVNMQQLTKGTSEQPHVISRIEAIIRKVGVSTTA